MARNAILSKFKNTFSFENTFLVFLVLENRKQEVKPNMFLEFIFFKNENSFQKIKIQTKHTLKFFILSIQSNFTKKKILFYSQKNYFYSISHIFILNQTINILLYLYYISLFSNYFFCFHLLYFSFLNQSQL